MKTTKKFDVRCPRCGALGTTELEEGQLLTCPDCEQQFPAARLGFWERQVANSPFARHWWVGPAFLLLVLGANGSMPWMGVGFGAVILVGIQVVISIEGLKRRGGWRNR